MTKEILVSTEYGEEFVVRVPLPACYKQPEFETERDYYICDWVDKHIKDAVAWE